MKIYLSKITHKCDGYTMTDVFSSLELAQIFQERFIIYFDMIHLRKSDNTIVLNSYNISIEIKELDTVCYPFCK